MDIKRDIDPVETEEWRQALKSVLAFEGPERANFLLAELVAEAHRLGAPVPYSANTPYVNTIRPDQEERHPGDRKIEHSIRALIRWNALATVLRANKDSSELGGHIASFQSAATLYDVGFMHFWRGASPGRPVAVLCRSGATKAFPKCCSTRRRTASSAAALSGRMPAI